MLVRFCLAYLGDKRIQPTYQTLVAKMVVIVTIVSKLGDLTLFRGLVNQLPGVNSS